MKMQAELIDFGESFRSKLNCAAQATNKNPAVSKTALGLQFRFNFPDSLPTGNCNLLKISTLVKATRHGWSYVFISFCEEL